jgi:hypothetical protein
MAIKPAEFINYCASTSGAKLEWQNPNRDELSEDWEWDGFEATKTPIRIIYPENVGTMIESVAIAPGGSIVTSSLDKNVYYTFVVTGIIALSGGDFADGCFLVNDGVPEPSDRLKTNDEQFANMFFRAAEQGDVEYEAFSHEYSIGYIGNDAPVVLTLAAGGTGILTIDIYPNEYRLAVFDDEENALFDVTRDRPFESLNLACGGECPSRTNLPCGCQGDRSCYWDNGNGQIAKIFEGSANP